MHDKILDPACLHTAGRLLQKESGLHEKGVVSHGVDGSSALRLCAPRSVALLRVLFRENAVNWWTMTPAPICSTLSRR